MKRKKGWERRNSRRGGGDKNMDIKTNIHPYEVPWEIHMTFNEREKNRNIRKAIFFGEISQDFGNYITCNSRNINLIFCAKRNYQCCGSV